MTCVLMALGVWAALTTLVLGLMLWLVRAE
jgi:hypothetical protein